MSDSGPCPEPGGAGGELFQPRPGCGIYLGQCLFHQRPRLEVTLRAHGGGGEVGDPEVGDVIMQWRAVGVQMLAELGVAGQETAVGQRREADRVAGPRFDHPQPWQDPGQTCPTRYPRRRRSPGSRSHRGTASWDPPACTRS